MLETGQVFAGRYRVRQLLAEGGMGAIFEAEHLGTERRVALKLLFPHIMSVASAREKFELEAKVAARVDSPHIVQVLDAGFDEATKSPYLVMELLEGSTLAAMVKARGTLGAREVVDLLRQVGAGLDAAHGYKDASGANLPIIHRDLKPENLFVSLERDGTSRVKILDFGIAKVLSDTTHVSQEIRGTPLYMAFEQVSAGRLSPATDIWALGLIAYYALTGQRYWRSATSESANVQSLFAEILTLPLERPSERMRQQNSTLHLGEAFDAWLLQCIDREPSRRFRTAGEAVQALEQALQQAPTALAPTLLAAPAIAAGRTATLPVANIDAPMTGTTPSLSAVASERSPSAPGRSRTLRFALLGVGVIALGGIGVWLSLSRGPEVSTARSAAASPSSATLPREAEKPESPPVAPTLAPAVAPIRVAPIAASPDAGVLRVEAAPALRQEGDVSALPAASDSAAGNQARGHRLAPREMPAPETAPAAGSRRADGPPGVRDAKTEPASNPETAARDTAARDTAARDTAARDTAARDTAARDEKAEPSAAPPPAKKPKKFDPYDMY